MLSGWASYDEDEEGQPLEAEGGRWQVRLFPSIVGGRYVYGRVEVVSLDDPAHPVTKAVLRAVPLQALMRWDAEQRLRTLANLADISEVENVRTRARQEVHEALATRKGGYVPDHWRKVADVYGNAATKPTEAVRHYLATVTGENVSSSTAASHVHRARKYRDPDTGKPYLTEGSR